MHAETARLLSYFAFTHLPEHLQLVSSPCATLAQLMAETLSEGPEVTVGLRKLLEAKDCFVRSALAPKDIAHETVPSP